jgi:phosphoribosylformylglycinamidine cyclo-ligase
MSESSNAYAKSGVDTEKGAEFVRRINSSVSSTHTPLVLGGLGGFSAAFDATMFKSYDEPVLLSCTDGVGTKLELARLLNQHNTIGIDLVAMCVNDLIVMGGKPLFFLDYIATGKLELSRMEQIMEGIVAGCKESNISLVGGETAEHPGVMQNDQYDLAGFSVGIVEKRHIIDGSAIKEGDIVIGLSSSGPHSNGFSLIRRLLTPNNELPKSQDELDFIKNYIFKPTRIYVKPTLSILSRTVIHGIVHITGGGFYENIPRIMKNGLGVKLNKSSLPKPYVFEKLAKDHNLSHEDLYSTFNMGIGMIYILPEVSMNVVQEELKKFKVESYILGVVKNQKDKVVFSD